MPTQLNPLEETLFHSWMKANKLMTRKQNPDDVEPKADYRGIYKATQGQVQPHNQLKQGIAAQAPSPEQQKLVAEQRKQAAEQQKLAQKQAAEQQKFVQKQQDVQEKRQHKFEDRAEKRQERQEDRQRKLQNQLEDRAIRKQFQAEDRAVKQHQQAVDAVTKAQQKPADRPGNDGKVKHDIKLGGLDEGELMYREFVNKRPEGKSRGVDSDGEPLPSVPDAPMFRKDPIVVSSDPDFQRTVQYLLRIAPELRGQLNKVVSGHTPASMTRHAMSGLPVDAFGSTTLMGIYDKRNKEIGINPTALPTMPGYGDDYGFKKVLAHEFAHAAGNDEVDSNVASDYLIPPDVHMQKDREELRRIGKLRIAELERQMKAAGKK